MKRRIPFDVDKIVENDERIALNRSVDNQDRNYKPNRSESALPLGSDERTRLAVTFKAFCTLFDCQGVYFVMLPVIVALSVRYNPPWPPGLSSE